MNPKVQKYAYFACLGVWMLGVVAFLGGLGVFGAQGSGEVVETTVVGGQTAPMPLEQPAFMASDPGFIVMNAQNAALFGGAIVMVGALIVAKHLNTSSDDGKQPVPDDLMVQ